MDFDDMLEELGELGKFQVTIYTLVCIPVLFAAANSLSYVFTAGVPDYRCFIPECEDVGKTSYDTPWIKWAIPNDDTRQQALDYKAALCDRFTINPNVSNSDCSRELFTRTIKTCSEWIFDHNERTIVNDWNITCVENQWKLSLVGTSHFAGIIVGSGLFGILADRYGRKIIFLFCIVLMSVSGCAQAVAPEYVSFLLAIFINAMGTSGVYPLAFIIGVEMVGKRKREVTGIVLNYFYAIGEALVALVAWLTKDWVYLQLIVSAPALLFLGYYWLVPESVRWLLANEKNQKAKGIICNVAKVNKVTLSEHLLDSFKESSALKNNDDEEEVKLWPMIKLTMRSKTLFLRFIIVYYIWAVMAFVFYGLSVNSTSMSGDKYINFALVSLVEIPGYTLAWVAIRILGRRLSLVGSLILCGLTCLSTSFVPDDQIWAIILLFLIGKLGVTSAFGVAYVHTAEMLPTIIRSGGVGSASTIARVGALAAPFIPLLGVYVKPLPMILFGGVAISAGLLGLKLPETLGKKLPETIEEAEEL